jgi:hypothetical protein
MAGIARRADGRWRARYRDAANREHARHFDRKVDAQAWLDSVTTAIGTGPGTYVDPDRGQATVGDLAPVWLAVKINLKPTSRARYADVLRTNVLPRWGDIPWFVPPPATSRPGWPSSRRAGCRAPRSARPTGCCPASSARRSATGG